MITPDMEETVHDFLLKKFGTPVTIYTDFETQQVRVEVYLPMQTWSPEQTDLLDHELKQIVGKVLASCIKVEHTILKKENWAESWKKHFKPLEFGSQLLIKPSWSKRKKKPGQKLVILDPGLSFGTGQHATTHYCLGRIVACRKKGAATMLDIGTGSGILAIAAAKLGYRPVETFDFDPDCVRTAQQNARRNRLDLSIFQRDLERLPIRPNRRFDVVCANLTYDLLISNKEKIVARLASGGTLILAGILDSQFAKVQESFEKIGMVLTHVKREREWTSGEFLRGKDMARGRNLDKPENFRQQFEPLREKKVQKDVNAR